MARSTIESSSAHFFDWMDGLEPLPYEAARRIADFSGCGLDWLLEGRGDPFPVADTGNPADYESHFYLEGRGDWRFHLIRFGDVHIAPGTKVLLLNNHGDELHLDPVF